MAQKAQFYTHTRTKILQNPEMIKSKQQNYSLASNQAGIHRTGYKRSLA